MELNLKGKTRIQLDSELKDLLGPYFHSLVISDNNTGSLYEVLIYETERGTECLIVANNSNTRNITLRYDKTARGGKIYVTENNKETI